MTTIHVFLLGLRAPIMCVCVCHTDYLSLYYSTRPGLPRTYLINLHKHPRTFDQSLILQSFFQMGNQIIL